MSVVSTVSHEPAPYEGWLTTAPEARKIGTVVAAAACVCLAVTAMVMLASVVLKRPLPFAWLLVVPAAPVILAGQLWAIAWAHARQVRHGRGQKVSLRDMVGPVPRPVAITLGALAVAGCLAGMLSFTALEDGGPGDPTPDCSYVLENHGSTTCTTHEAYERASTAEQRAAAGVLMFFFAAHAAAAIGGLRSHRHESRARGA